MCTITDGSILRKLVFAVVVCAFIPSIADAKCGKPLECVEDALSKLQNAVNEIKQLKELNEELRKNLSPVGGVILWWGDKTKIPQGWELCDGNFSKELDRHKPNLQDIFVRGASNSKSSVGSLGVGGSDVYDLIHAHNIPAFDLPSNNLYVPIGRALGAIWTWDPSSPDGNSQNYGGGRTSHVTHTTRGVNGGDPNVPLTKVMGTISFPGATTDSKLSSVDNKPRYQEMFYIIRVR